MVETVDLTQEIYEGMPTYKGHLETKIWQHHTFAETAPLFESEFCFQSLGLQLCDHGPTHVDAISHLDPSPGAPTIDRMPLTTFWGTGTAIDVEGIEPGTSCTAERLRQAAADSPVEIEPGDVLLLRTGVAERLGGQPEYASEYPGFDQSAAEWLVERQVKVFGVDAPSPDTPGDPVYPIHLMCRERGITHYENLTNLSAVVGKRFEFFGLPLKIRGGTGSPVRAVAILRD